jgi:nucleoid DNA-binding protein
MFPPLPLKFLSKKDVTRLKRATVEKVTKKELKKGNSVTISFFGSMLFP